MHRWTGTAPTLTFPSDNLALRDPVKPIKMLKMQIDPAMCMKTKEAPDKMTGVFQNVRDILCKITDFCGFQSEKKPENAVHERVYRQYGAGWVLAVGDWVLGGDSRRMPRTVAPDYCSAKMKVHPGMLMKTQEDGSGRSVRETRQRRDRPPGRVPRGIQLRVSVSGRGCAPILGLLIPNSGLLLCNNEGVSGDLDENTRRRFRDVRETEQRRDRGGRGLVAGALSAAPAGCWGRGP
jgi:hypothetical protein